MTKPLDSHLSQRDAPQARGSRRPRTWLVALLGFGAADLLVLNLWAVPKLIPSATTTDMRAAQSGEVAGAVEPAEPQPQAAVVAQQGAAAPEPEAVQAEPAPHADDAPAQVGAQADLEVQQPARDDGSAATQPARTAQPGARVARHAERAALPRRGDSSAQEGAEALQPQEAAQVAHTWDVRQAVQPSEVAQAHAQAAQPRGAQGSQPSEAAQPHEALAQQEMNQVLDPRPGDRAAQRRGAQGSQPSEPHEAVAQTQEGDRAAQQGAPAQHEGAAAHANADSAYPAQQAVAAQPGQSPAALAESAGTPEPAARAPRAESPPGGAPPQAADVVDVPADPAVARAFAMRAAQRAVRVVLNDRAAFSGNSPFEALTEADHPLTQIFFSLGNFTLGPNGKQLLERKLPQLTQDQSPILIVGAADPSGTEQINSKLSDARAQSVAEWLLAHGVEAQRIQTHAIGHEGAVGSTLDRRVDIWLGGSK